jgi:hypothetical protein
MNFLFKQEEQKKDNGFNGVQIHHAYRVVLRELHAS